MNAQPTNLPSARFKMLQSLMVPYLANRSVKFFSDVLYEIFRRIIRALRDRRDSLSFLRSSAVFFGCTNFFFSFLGPASVVNSPSVATVITKTICEQFVYLVDSVAIIAPEFGPGTISNEPSSILLS